VILSGTPVSSTNETDCHDITEILLIVALNTITLTQKPITHLFDVNNKRVVCTIFDIYAFIWNTDLVLQRILFNSI
jgi:hypothetical protein